MKITDLNIGTTRFDNLDKMFPAQEMLIQSGQLVQYAAGLFGFNKIPLGIKQRIEQVIREVFEEYGIVEVLLPILHPKEIWEKSGRWQQYIDAEVMLHTESSRGVFALGPTAEEAIVEFARQKLNSYKQFPVIYYQMNDKFRNEIRSRGYLMRGIEFTMMDAYSFDTTPDNARKSYKKVYDAYIEIFKRLEMDVISVAADSGAMGGSQSEEFMFLSPLGEDTILYDAEHNIGLNTEILEREDYEEYLKQEYGIDDISHFEEVRAAELGHVFNLGSFYSESMDLEYMDKDEKKKLVYMGCYGIGISRMVAVIYENSLLKKDDRITGMSIPLAVAPYMTQIIYSESKKDFANDLYNELLKEKVTAILDNREDKKLSIGARINDVKILGTPFVTIIGDKTEEGFIELEYIKTGQKYILPKDIYIETMKAITKDRKFDTSKIDKYKA